MRVRDRRDAADRIVGVVEFYQKLHLIDTRTIWTSTCCIFSLRQSMTTQRSDLPSNNHQLRAHFAEKPVHGTAREHANGNEKVSDETDPHAPPSLYYGSSHAPRNKSRTFSAVSSSATVRNNDTSTCANTDKEIPLQIDPSARSQVKSTYKTPGRRSSHGTFKAGLDCGLG